MEFDEVVKKVKTVKDLNVDILFQIQDGDKTIYKLEAWDLGIIDLFKLLWKMIKNIISLRKKK